MFINLWTDPSVNYIFTCISKLNHAMNLGLEFLKLYKVNFSCALRNLKEQIDEWIEQGVVEPANSTWATS